MKSGEVWIERKTPCISCPPASVKVKMLQTNVMTGKEYPKYLRFKRNNKTFKSAKLKFHLPSKQLSEEYEKRKKALYKLNQKKDKAQKRYSNKDN